MVKTIWAISDTHDDIVSLEKAVDYIGAQGLKNSCIVHAGDFVLRPYRLESLHRLIENSTDDESFRRNLPSFLAEKKRTNNLMLVAHKEILDAVGMPYFVVPGNYDCPLDEVFGEENIHNKRTRILGFNAVGYGGAGMNGFPWVGPGQIKVLVDLNEIVLENYPEIVDLFRGSDPQIVVAHNPSFLSVDCMFNGQRVGNRILRQLIESSDVKLGIYGHIHECGPLGENPSRIGGLVYERVQKNQRVKRVFVNPGNLGRFALLDEKLDPIRTFDYGTFVRVDLDDDGTPVNYKAYKLIHDNVCLLRETEIK